LYKILSIDIKRAFLSRRFLCTVASIAFVLLFSSAYQIFNGLGSVYDAYSAASGRTGSELMTMILLPLIPYSISFAEDWNAHVPLYWTHRIGAGKYCLSRILISALSAWCSAFLGMWLFVAILAPFLSLDQMNGSSGPYGCYLQQGRQELYFVFEFSHQALTALFFSVVAVFISTIVPDALISLAVPAAFYIVALAVSQNLNIPAAVSLGVSMAGRYNAGTPLASLAVKALNMLFRAVLLGGATYINMRRRLK